MSQGIPGLGITRPSEPDAARTESVMTQQPLHRVLAFVRRDIDQIINDPIARREVLGYYKLYCRVLRSCEVVELERQWNPVGHSL